jgi:hypothetical protein
VTGPGRGDGPGTAGTAETVPVVLRELPLELARRSDEHQADLLREFALLSLDPGDHADVPRRLLALVAELEERYSEASAAVDRDRSEAEARGEQSTDLVVAVPGSAAASARRLLSLLEEADEYCRRGEHLLTVESDPEVVAFRRWYLGEFAAQVEGRSPTPWPLAGG